jgi:hypothetical protein
VHNFSRRVFFIVAILGAGAAQAPWTGKAELGTRCWRWPWASVRYNTDPPPLAEDTDTLFTVNLVYNIK